MRRTLPTESEAREILARCRTKPPLRPPPRAGRHLTGLVKKLDAEFGRSSNALENRWVEIVGERLARVCRPQKMTKGRGGAPGTLELRVVGAAALLIQHQSEDIIERVNLFLGTKAVDKIRIQQGPVKPLPAVTAKPRPAGRRALPPLPAGTEAELQTQLEPVPDRLKAALQKLGRAVLSQPPENGVR